MSEDLQKLLSKRSDIENLQATLQGLISNSSKKIDIDDLKGKLADRSRVGKSFQSTGNNGDASTLSMNSKKLNKSNRSKSPGDDLPERGSAVKFEGDPAWYKALKKNLK